MYISAVDVAFLTVSRGGSKITKRGGLLHGDEVWLGNLLFESWGEGCLSSYTKCGKPTINIIFVMLWKHYF